MTKKSKKIKSFEIFSSALIVLVFAFSILIVYFAGYFYGKRVAFSIQIENSNITIPCPYNPPFKICESTVEDCAGSKSYYYDVKDGSMDSFFCADKKKALWLQTKLNKK